MYDTLPRRYGWGAEDQFSSVHSSSYPTFNSHKLISSFSYSAQGTKSAPLTLPGVATSEAEQQQFSFLVVALAQLQIIVEAVGVTPMTDVRHPAKEALMRR